MIKYFSAKINKFANKRSMFVLLAISILVMIVINNVNMPVSATRVNQLSNGAGILDMRMYYNSQEAYQLLGELTPQGRNTYMKLLTEFDFAFPFIYSLSLSFIVAVLFRKIFPNSPGLQRLCLIPFVAGIFDWLENISILAMLANYPNSVDIAYAAGYLTLFKWAFTGSILILIITGIIILILRRKTENCAFKGERCT